MTITYYYEKIEYDVFKSSYIVKLRELKVCIFHKNKSF